ncbi:MAG: PQQ-binding-like beta-propeller repeat protein [Phycisphaerales bacterium]|nr:PQQ-binding-like beta-propeller repeat protein [Phycisphaerales bacterium]
MLNPRLSSRVCRIVRGAVLSAALAAGVLAGLVPTGCGTGYASRSPEERRAKFPINHADYRRVGYRLDWVGFPVATGKGRINFIHADSDVVATLEEGSTVSLLAAGNGAVRWTNQLGDRLTRFVGLDRIGSRVYASGEGDLFLLDVDSGNVVSRQKYQKIVSTPPVIYGSLLIYGTGVGEVFAHMVLSAVEGVKAWGNHITGAIVAAPVLVGTSVGVVTQTGRVMFIDAESGTPTGSNQIYDGTVTDPVASDRVMYIAGLDQSLWAFNASGGTQLWRVRTDSPLRVQPTLHGAVLYCELAGKGLTAFDAQRGTVIWTSKAARGQVIATNGGRLECWDGRTMYLIDAANGDVIERATLPGVAKFTTDKFDDGNLYAVSTSGLVVKFAPVGK